MSLQVSSNALVKNHTIGLASSLDVIRTVLSAEIEALQALVNNLPVATTALINELLVATGSIIFMGTGKSGHVGRKLSATFASLGIPAFFVHPHDALHGDIGMIRSGDVVIMLSKSGTGSELELVALLLKQRSIKTVLVCCTPGSLGDLAALTLQLPLEREACLLNLAPTSSSTMMGAFGDALAAAVSLHKGFTSQDFARNHPAGALGKSLLLDVAALMNTHENLPLLAPTTPFATVLAVMMEKKLGVGIVVGEDSTLLGIITDGDLRRACAQGPTVFETCAQDLMSQNPKVVAPSIRASHALALMEDHNITTLVVLDTTHRVVGLLHIHALLKAGIRKVL